jgi:4-hydroxy-tetrahydrodipicolinate synthase
MLGGVMVPLVTPVTPDGSVCPASVARLVASVRPFVTGLVPALSSGEGWRLSSDRWMTVVKATVAAAAGLPVLAGVETSSTAVTLERAAWAAELGASAVVVSPPVGSSLDDGGVIEHYRVVARRSRLPVIAYHEPKLFGRPLSLPCLLAICALDNVVGVKESSGDVALTNQLAARAAAVAVFQGWENLCAASQGVAGYILPLANLEPRLCQAMFERPSLAVQQEMNDHCQQHRLFEDGWYQGLKAELAARGTITTALILR